MDPISASFIISTAATAGSQVISGVSSMQTGKANAAVYRQQAALREVQAQVDIETADRNQRRDMGKKVSGAAASGIDTRSFLDVFADDLAEGALEKSKIKYGATIDANNLRAKAANAEMQGKAALVGSIFGAVGSAAAGYGKARAYDMKSTAGSAVSSAGVEYGD